MKGGTRGGGGHQNPAGWQASYDAGASGTTDECLPEVSDQLPFVSGYIQPKAARERARTMPAMPGDDDDRTSFDLHRH